LIARSSTIHAGTRLVKSPAAVRVEVAYGMTGITVSRQALVRRSLYLNYSTLAYNSLEGLVAIAAGLTAGSIALVGFGLDSLIEVSASLAALWRLYRDNDERHRAQAELVTLRIIGALFLALATYVAVDAIHALYTRTAPDESIVGIALATLSLGVMPLLARAKGRVARALSSGALVAEARQTIFCTYLSAILLAGLLLNAAVGWWWADPIAALVMVPLIAKEGFEGIRGRSACGDCCPDPPAA
jgi:divalent metal cation (Fe/Co/Zn/Cd) transporter